MMEENTTLYRASVALREILENSNIDQGHGIDHALTVLDHTKKALSYSNVKDPKKRLIILLTALLHDADDRKFFPENDDNQNAKFILERVLPGKKDIHESVIYWIDRVSFSKNGNTLLDGSDDIDEEYLYPCISDRCEATGEIGIIRCYLYTIHVKRPLYTDETPRCKTEEELNELCQERLPIYLRDKKSDTFIDHFYDKIYHLSNVEVKNPYLRNLLKERHEIIVSFLLKFGEKGEVQKSTINRMLNKVYPKKKK